ncbi:MAG: hypothetical protein L0Z62_15470 [Gemmataceae bacterium]|nr:hypothetical protein [Gemmataceae bacterium]
MEKCPHCGTRLPLVVDAFCPECFSPLEEQQFQPGGSPAADGGSPAERRAAWVTLLIMLGGAAGLFAAVLAATRGSWADAVYTGAGSIVLMILAVWYANRPRDKNG